jgi:hypothetical protein
MKEQVRINSAFVQINALQGISAKVIGSQAYRLGQVRSEADKARAAQLVSSLSHLQVINFPLGDSRTGVFNAEVWIDDRAESETLKSR